MFGFQCIIFLIRGDGVGIRGDGVGIRGDGVGIRDYWHFLLLKNVVLIVVWQQLLYVPL